MTGCMLVAFSPSHRWLILVHNLKPRSVSVFLHSTASSGLAFYALPSVQPQAPLALGLFPSPKLSIKGAP